MFRMPPRWEWGCLCSTGFRTSRRRARRPRRGRDGRGRPTAGGVRNRGAEAQAPGVNGCRPGGREVRGGPGEIRTPGTRVKAPSRTFRLPAALRSCVRRLGFCHAKGRNVSGRVRVFHGTETGRAQVSAIDAARSCGRSACSRGAGRSDRDGRRCSRPIVPVDRLRTKEKCIGAARRRPDGSAHHVGVP
jgi:hypothetical protein